jgi:hypothetical protein
MSPSDFVRYFAAFSFFAFAAASRSVFLRRAARFFTLSLPWLFPITRQHSPVLSQFQAVSHTLRFVPHSPGMICVGHVFYRGYAIERVQAVELNCYLAAAIPLAIFAVAHWTGGWVNIVTALALGAILSASHLWGRDLVANMIGHFLVDFVSNVLPRLFAHP